MRVFLAFLRDVGPGNSENPPCNSMHGKRTRTDNKRNDRSQRRIGTEYP